MWHYLFGLDWKLVHVMRDPRASCRVWNNKVQYTEVCPFLMNPPELCAYPKGCFRYWADLNFQVREFFYEDDLMDQYVPLILERVAMAEEPAVGTIPFNYLKYQLAKINPDVTDDDVLNILQAERPYAKHYQR